MKHSVKMVKRCGISWWCRSAPEIQWFIDKSSSSNLPRQGFSSTYCSDYALEKNWNLYLFHLPRRYWNDIRNQQTFLEWIAMQRGFRTHEDWYQFAHNGSVIPWSTQVIWQKDMVSLGGGGLLEKYNGSLIKALQTVYPGKVPFARLSDAQRKSGIHFCLSVFHVDIGMTTIMSCIICSGWLNK